MAPTAMERLLARRDVIENNLSRINGKIKHHSSTPISERVAERYEESIDTDMEALRNLQAEILVATTAEDIDEHKQKFNDLYDVADILCNVLHGIKISYQPQSSSANSKNSSATSSTKLPKLDLHTFDGNLIEWISFRDMFESAVHNNPSVSKVQKLVYLKSLLKGEASRLVNSLILSESNYDTAWQLLHDRYQNQREILFSVLRKLFSLPNSNSSAMAIRQLVDSTKDCIRSMEIINLKTDLSSEAIILYVLIEKLDQTSRQLWEQSLSDTFVPRLCVLFEFLEQRSRAVAATSSNPTKTKPHRGEERAHTFHGQSSSSASCQCCNGNNHPMFKCTKFQSLGTSAKYDLLKKNGACFNCLQQGHSTSSCTNTHRCKTCNKKHHSLLHSEPTTDRNSENPTSSQVQTHHGKSNCNQGLLVTAVTQIKGKDGLHHLARAFLDSGSTSSFITESMVNRLGLKRRKSSVEVVGLAATNVGTSQGVVTISISPYFDKSVSLTVEALVMPKVTQNLPDQLQSSNYPHLKNIKLADPSWFQPAPVDLLLGSEIFWNILGSNRITGPSNSPTAIDSKLGWLVAGTISSASSNSKVEVHFASECALENQLRKFWELESIESKKLFTTDEEKCENHFSQTHSRNSAGVFTVALPFKSPAVPLGDSREIAARRLKSLEKRLAENEDYKTEYTKFMDEYESMGHMSNVTYRKKSCNSNPIFIPHHFVLKEESTTTKFRVVFDASAKTSSGYSLNDHLLVGPTLQDNLVDIVHRFRLHAIAFTADIAKMYRQIRMKPEDRKFQSILWRRSPSEPIQEYELNTVTYGTACAPYLAVKCLRTLAESTHQKFPLGSAVALENFYVDDVMNSTTTLETAMQTQRQLQDMCFCGGFELRKWASNSKEFLETIPDTLREKSVFFDINIDPSIKTLGIRWNTETDEFQFKFQCPTSDQLTKRSILSSIAKLYDPMGWLAPVVIRAKIFMQSLWKLNLSWDHPLPSPQLLEWKEIEDDFQNINQIKIPRCLIDNDYSEFTLAGFSDASEKAYSACVYLCCYSPSSSKSSLVSSKTRVAPVKSISLPKLELCGAVLLAELMESVAAALKIPNMKFMAWSDSTIVLSWINSPPTKWKCFVANRISSIQSRAIEISWFHIPGHHNPADCASRGIGASELSSFTLWWNGPEILQTSNFQPSNPILTRDDPQMLQEQRPIPKQCFVIQNDESFELLNSSFNLSKVIRLTAWCLRFQRNTLSRLETVRGPLKPAEIQTAINIWIKKTQLKYFNEEFQCLKRKSNLPKKSKLLTLNPFLDENSIIRVGGRLRHSSLLKNQKFPVILPRHSTLTEMVILDCHLKYLHSGPSLTQSILMRNFWIIRMKDAVRFKIKRCITCAKVAARPEFQLMGDLPASRVTPTSAFDRCGVDYAGPFNLKSGKRKQSKIEKAYLALFVCFSTRAFHLELVSSLTTDAFLAALKRFVSRRGLPSHIHSDCGTNFVGADRELRSLFTSSAHNIRVADALSKDMIIWHFNPPGAPHMGGLWEAGVKSVKHHLNRILTNYNLCCCSAT